MIRRDGPRRPAARVLTPTYKTEELPPWSPSAPRTGWTPSSAWTAALDYADEHDGLYDARILTTAAYRALLGAIPGLHRADVLSRLQGADVRNAPAPVPPPF